MDLAVIAITFGAIFVVELPDKTFIAALVLATRYRPLLVWVGVGLAFHISNRRASRAERVRVSAERIEVERHSVTVWRSPTAFTTVALEGAGDPRARVELRLSGRSITVGDRLSPRERAVFADALSRAIAAARAERHSP